eukprot:GHVP01061866.1.p1 GENE.GHVP01061866.1~~GHVP01061866.1.p1  ORF type:complete len:103 (+),score=18.31 GHVP01061866.1:333-641(+)
MDPVVRHDPPGLGLVQYRQRCYQTEEMSILTQQGFMSIQECKKNGNEALYPPLKPSRGIPLDKNGFPDIEKIRAAAEEYKARYKHDGIQEPLPERSSGCSMF